MLAIKIQKIILFDTETKEIEEADIDLIKSSLNEDMKIDGMKTVADLFARLNKKEDKISELKYLISELRKDLPDYEIKEIMENEFKHNKSNTNFNVDIYHKTAIEMFKQKNDIVKKENLTDEIKAIIRNLIANLRDDGHRTENIAKYVKEFMTIHNDLSCEMNLFKFTDELQEKNLIIPNGVKRVYINKESQLSGAKVKFKGELKLPETLEVIDDGVFDMCDSLKGSLKLPPNLKVIGEGAFRNCINITNIEVNDTIESIEQNAFLGCIGIDGKISFPSTLKKVGKSAFEGCKNIKGINFSEGTLEIEKKAFNKCEKIEELKLPTTLVKLGAGAFNECRSLKGNIELPPGIRNVENYTFGNCEELNEVKIAGAELGDINKYAFEGCKKLEAVFVNREANKNLISRFR